MDITFCEKKIYNVKIIDTECIIKEDNFNNDEKINDDNKMSDEDKIELTKKVKLLGLNKMNKSIFTNTSNMRDYERIELQKMMRTYEDIDVKDIINEFNNLMNVKVFDNPDVDISKIPIYSNN